MENLIPPLGYRSRYPANPNSRELQSMDQFETQGRDIREMAKTLVLQFMSSHSDAGPSGCGLKQAEIFRRCGFSFGEQIKATPSNQQYWVVALLRDLEAEGLVEQTVERGPWRLSDA